MEDEKKRILVLGASGMLGNSVLRFLSQNKNFNVYGTVRNENKKAILPKNLQDKIFSNVDVLIDKSLEILFNNANPDVVINCIGITKQQEKSDNALISIPINSLLPHKLYFLSNEYKARFIHISTDCVFSGEKGMYVESDQSDASDLYGKTKYLGEVCYKNSITLRTSIIGHELESKKSLVDWFLSQKGIVKGFNKAIFSGLPTVEISRIIQDFVLPNKNLDGIYHLSAEPINKFDLLKLIAETYKKEIQITKDSSISINRALDSTIFRNLTGFKPLSWPNLIQKMYEFK